MFSRCWRDSTLQKQNQSPLLWQVTLIYLPSSVHNPPVEKEEISRVSHANAVGSLIYVMVCTRPDLAYAVSTVSQFMSNSGKQH